MYVDLGPENGGFSINVSEGGMAFQGVRPLEKDQFIHINFKLPGLSSSVESAAQIAWLNDLGKGGGLRFIDLPDCTRRLINEWLSLQTLSRSLAESSPILITRCETKSFQLAPDILHATNQNHSPVQADPPAIERLLESPLPPVAVPEAIKTNHTVPLPVPPAHLARDSRFRDPGLESKRRKAWIAPASLGLIAALTIVAILGIISFRFRGSWQLPVMSGNPGQPGNESVAATAHQTSSEMRTADPPPGNPTDAVSASPASRFSIDPIGPSEEPSASKQKARVARPAKMVALQKIGSPKNLSQKMGTNSKQVTPRLKVMSPAGDLTPPTLALPAGQALPAQLPALLLEMPSPAPAPREPAQQRSKFDAAQLIARNNPVYPKVAQALGLSGSVELHFIIGADGYVRGMTVVKGNPLLARAAVEAVRTWRYQPARRDGVPVETESSTVFAFKPN